jgi:serine/threonine protein kinase
VAPYEEPSFSTDLQRDREHHSSAPWHNDVIDTDSLTVRELMYRMITRFTIQEELNVKGGISNGLFFMTSDLDYYNEAAEAEAGAEEGEWTPFQLLGAGSFGRVGQWRKANGKGEVLDEIALKQSHRIFYEDGGNPINVRDGYDEAIIQTALQQKERRQIAVAGPKDENDFTSFVEADPHILNIRRYKYSAMEKLNRLYLEVARHGTLWDLIDNYQAFNQPMPDTFLWHMFHSLALGIQTMAGPLEKDAFEYERRKVLDKADWRTVDDFILHCNIKSENIMLSSSILEQKGLTSKSDFFWNIPSGVARMYPSVKLVSYAATMPWKVS